MARPRKKEIALSSLDCFSIIEDELSTPNYYKTKKAPLCA